MSGDKGRLVPVLCTIRKFTASAVVLQTYHEDDAAADALEFSVGMSLCVLQTIESWEYRGNTISKHMPAGQMTHEQKADAMLADFAIAWLPEWKVADLGVRTMEPIICEVAL